jgi:hypothetical protein
MPSVIRQWTKSVLSFLLLAAGLAAQTFTGSIIGTVTDPAGAMVPGATLSLNNHGHQR